MASMLVNSIGSLSSTLRVPEIKSERMGYLTIDITVARNEVVLGSVIFSALSFVWRAVDPPRRL
jgi:hypothetical protein